MNLFWIADSRMLSLFGYFKYILLLVLSGMNRMNSPWGLPWPSIWKIIVTYDYFVIFLLLKLYFYMEV